MFNTKQEVDRHVEKCLRNMNSEVERNVRGLAFAKMYYKVGDNEQALRYVTVYLNTKPTSAEGQNLHGKILEKLGKTTQALEAYRLSLDLDCKQNSLVLKICELMAKEHHFDSASARYYCEKARTIDPSNPVIFHLKERLVAAASKDPNDVTDLLLKELESRPFDVDVRVRLLRHLVQHNRARDAYTHVYDIEQKHIPVYLNHPKWCEAAVDVLRLFRGTQNALTWEFWMLYVSAWDRHVALGLNDRTKEFELAPLVIGLDQAMQLAADKVATCPHKQLAQEFVRHYTGQICWHLLTLMYKQARKALIKFREAAHTSLPLLFAAYGNRPADARALWLDQATQGARLQVQRWHREGAYRCAQAGHMLVGMALERKNTVLERGAQALTGTWREKTYKFLFVTREQQGKAASSFFNLTKHLLDVPVRLPESDDLIAYTRAAQLVHPDSLHHHVWLGLSGKSLSDYEVNVFAGLQYSVKAFSNCAAETLSVLDVQAFVYAASLCAQAQLDEQKQTIYYNAERPAVLPIACTDLLGTGNQETWLLCAYKMFSDHPTRDFAEVRMALVRGIETVRCVGNHGLDAKLLAQLARAFAERAAKLAKQSEVEANEARAELYWRAALHLLEKHRKSEHVSYTAKRLFEYKCKELSQDQIQQAINDAKLYLGRQAMKKKDYETAMNMFKSVKDPYASFYQAQMYKMMADKETSLKSENVTSEMRSQNIILLTKARDCFYLTSDRLRMPGVDPKHPLFEVLFTDIEKIDRLLSRIDPDNNRNECDGMSDDNVSSIESDFNCTMSRLETSHHGVHSTPFRTDHSRREAREARPSPERLDAQIRQLAASKDVVLNKVLEQNKFVIDTQKAIAEELKFFRESVSDLSSTINELKSLKIVADDVKEMKKTVEELDNLRSVNDMVQELKKEVAELKKEAAAAASANKSKNQNQLSDEDLYAFDDDYAAEIANAHSTLSTSLYQTAGRINPMNQSVQNLGYPTSPMYSYPMYPPPYAGMPGMPLPQVPGVSAYPQAHAPPDAAAALAADYRTMNLLQGYSQLATGMQAPALGASPGYMAQQYAQYPQAQTQPQAGLFGGTSAQSQTTPVQPAAKPWSFAASPTVASTPTAMPALGLAATTTVNAATPAMTTAVTGTPTSRPAPVNVVITSSDPLPKAITTQQQVLSVTIPPEHLKGNKVHNYQITLPSSVSSMTNAPSVLSQAPLVVSTQSLLSHVSAPVYSALTESPPKNISSSGSALGLQIEKSLNSSFNRTANDSECDASREEEHDPCPDFKPIIPLPDEVPVTTGEENEVVLFKERAKLFRYVQKEWKERGVGELKILQDKQTNKVRLLMRRDQVHKICANHYLSPDIVLNAMKNNAKAYIWAANDFSDDKMNLETFCGQFKTPEIGKKFFDCFEKAKQEKSVATPPRSSAPAVAAVSSSAPTFATPTKPSTAAAVTSNLGGFKFTSPPTFKPKEDEAPKPVVSKAAEAPKNTASPFAAFSFSSAGSAAATPPASKPFSAFTFGTPSGAADKPPATNLFASLSASTTSTPNKATVPPAVKPATPATPAAAKSPGKEDEEEDFVPTAEFKPVIPLPDLVEVKTGEENAEVLFENKAKLLRYDPKTKEWKERGIGQMKILKGDDILRLVMRREQVHKVCCNHQVLKQMQFTKMSKSQTAVTWCAKDFSEGVLSTETLAIKFKTEELAAKFLAVLQSAQAQMDDANNLGGGGGEKRPENKLLASLAKGFGDSFKPKAGDWECKNCLVVNQAKVSRCVACETPKNDAVAKSKVDDSKFCFGTKPPGSSSGASFSFGTATSTTASGAAPGFGDQFKPKQGSWECKECYTRNDASKDKCVSCEVPKSGAAAPAAPAASNASTLKGVDLSTGGLSFSFGFPAAAATPTKSDADSTSSSAVSSTTSVPSAGFGDQFKPKTGSWECKGCYTRNDADKLYCLSCESPKDSTVPPKADASAAPGLKGVDLSTGGQSFTFGIPAGTPAKTTFSFAAAAPATADAPKSTGFSFTLNASATKGESQGDDTVEEVFGSPHKAGFEFTPRSPRRQSGGQQLDEDGDDSYYEEEEASVYFKPVIPLPDKVTVTTGEEDEDVLYCHRAKLYRHHEGEWKERGIGDLKILLQKEQRKLRVLMRREQVHKICLNHVLTRDVAYSKKDDKTWLFAAADFSDGEINRSSFCLRFKTVEVAEEFMKAINDALKRAGGDGEAVEDGSDSDVEFVSETVVTADEIAEAERLRLPPKFMAYRQLEDCTCDQCKKEDAEEKGVVTPQKNLFGGGASQAGGIFGAAKSTFSFANFASPKAAATPPPKEESVKDLLLKPSLLGTNSSFSFASPAATAAAPAPAAKPSVFGAFSSAPPAGGSIFGQQNATGGTPFSGGNIFGQSGAPIGGGSIFGGAGATTAPGGGGTFSFASFAKPADAANKPETKPAESAAAATFSFASMGKPKEGQTAFSSFATQPVMGANSSVSFASLAANAENMPFGKPKASTENPFANLGAGAPVFGAKPANKAADTSKNDDDDEEAGGDNEHDPHYDPIVPLPDEVEVKTGEEDEEILFSERGKLYRFTNKEWKERGVGNIKVLFHPVNKTYRLLLRRDAVHKIVLNQRIVPDLEVRAFALSANSWMWVGMNFGEEGHQLEQLAARFKNETLSQAFYDAVQKAIQGSASTMSAVQPPLAAAQSNAVENVSDPEEEDDEDDDKDEDYDEEEDDERTVMCSCECSLQELVGNTWLPVINQGNVEIVYDREYEETRIIVTNDVGMVLSNTLITPTVNMERKPDDNGCELHWQGIEDATEKGEWRTLKLTLENEDETNSFYMAYQEGKSYVDYQAEEYERE